MKCAQIFYRVVKSPPRPLAHSVKKWLQFVDSRWSFHKLQLIWKSFVKYLDKILSGQGHTKHFMKKCIFRPIFWYFLSFHHTIHIAWSKHIFQHPTSLFLEWAYFWSETYQSIETKCEGSCSKNHFLSCKMTLFFFSVFFLKCLCSLSRRSLVKIFGKWLSN